MDGIYIFDLAKLVISLHRYQAVKIKYYSGLFNSSRLGHTKSHYVLKVVGSISGPLMVGVVSNDLKKRFN